MERFTRLYQALDETTATGAKVAALEAYFREAPAADAAWAVYFLTGRRLKRLVTTGELRAWTREVTGMPAWLLEETYASVGDLAETLALLLDNPYAPPAADPTPLHVWVEQRIQPLRGLDDAQRRAVVTGWWAALPTASRFLLNKMLTGAFRVGVSRRLVVRALARVSGLEAATLAHRLMGQWQPSAEHFRALVDPREQSGDSERPYPFFLASALDGDPEQLGDRDDWQAEWKWDGIRGQLLRRAGACSLWSRGEEMLNGRFPEIEAAAAGLPEGTVLDGEILAWRDGGALPFSVLQRRIGRLRPSARIQREAPVAFLAYDLLESEGQDRRGEPLEQRRQRLLASVADDGDALLVSRPLPGADWAELARYRDAARSHGTEGIMLKRYGSPYRVGRTRGDWWKWKLAPLTIDAVLLYAQPGHGRRSSLFTDYTLGVWDGDALVPVAKAYSGLTDAEIRRLDRWIRSNTLERFGPVRSVTPQQVFEIAFEGLAPSGRHKSGVALRFPRISRWRTDLAPAAADRLADVHALLPE